MARFGNRAIPSSGREMLAKELGRPVEGNHIHLILEIGMVGALDDPKFLLIGSNLVSILAEILRKRLHTYSRPASERYCPSTQQTRRSDNFITDRT